MFSLYFNETTNYITSVEMKCPSDQNFEKLKLNQEKVNFLQLMKHYAFQTEIKLDHNFSMHYERENISLK